MKDGKDDSIETAAVRGNAYGLIRHTYGGMRPLRLRAVSLRGALCMLGAGLAFRAADKNIEPKEEHSHE